MNCSYDQQVPIIDGTLIIYTLQGAKKKTWYMRIKFPNQKYIRRSLRTTDIHDAIQLARNAYFDQRGRVALNMPIGEHTFNQVLERYRNSRDGHWSSFDRIADNYVKVFFADNVDITHITKQSIDDYWKWRRSYWLDNDSTVWSEESGYRVTNFATNPSASTLSRDLYVIRRVFRYALDNSFVKSCPEIKLPRGLKHDRNETSRGSFTPAEYRYVNQCLRKEVSATLPADATAGQIRSWRPMMRRRRRLQTFILLLANSGLRPSEAVRLRYKDIRPLTSSERADYGTTYTVIDISADISKVGKQRLVYTRDGSRTLERITYYRNLYADPRCVADDDLIFHSNRDFTRPVDIQPTMKQFLNKYDLRIADDGKHRSAYSFRKVYASNRIQQGVGLHSLAINMGTSYEMLFRNYLLHETHEVREELTVNRRKDLNRVEGNRWKDADM